MITIKRTCPNCGKLQTVTVNETEYNNWKSGQFIQIAFPNMSADDREILLSGLCKDCWDKLMPPDDE